MANTSSVSWKKRSISLSPPGPQRLLVTGASGQVGGELVQTLAPLGTILAPVRAEFDLADPTSIRTYIRSARPRWIVNAGAYTAVDRAQSESSLAFAVNAEAVQVMAEEANALESAIIHFSTDYVFTGQGTRPYKETDPTGPLGVYGDSKLAGERALHATNPASLTFRTSWVYGATGRNFLLTILKLARERHELRIVCDQHGAPTWSRDLARMAAHIITTCEGLAGPNATNQTLRSAVTRVAGIYHAAGSGETTWAGFAEEAIRRAENAYPSTRFATVTPIPTSQYPTPARRPINSRLNCEKLEKVFNWKMMAWQDSMAEVFTELQ